MVTALRLTENPVRKVIWHRDAGCGL